MLKTGFVELCFPHFLTPLLLNCFKGNGQLLLRFAPFLLQ